MEQKQKIEIERESVLLTNEYNKKMKQIKMGLLSFHLLDILTKLEIYLDQDKELKLFREQIREQFKQIKRDFDTPYNTMNNPMFINNGTEIYFALILNKVFF